MVDGYLQHEFKTHVLEVRGELDGIIAPKTRAGSESIDESGKNDRHERYVSPVATSARQLNNMRCRLVLSSRLVISIYCVIYLFFPRKVDHVQLLKI